MSNSISFAPAVVVVVALVLHGCRVSGPTERTPVLSPPTAVTPLELVATLTQPGEDDVFGSPGAVALDDDGNVYVGDYQQQTVFVLSQNGSLIRTIGAGGEGPGEFQIPVTVDVTGDSVFVFDNRLYRVSVFDRTDGSYVRSVSAKVDEWNPLTTMGYGDGTILLVATSTGEILDDPESQWSYSIRRMTTNGSEAEGIWDVPGPETFPMEFNGRPSIRVMPLAQHPTCTFDGGLAYCAHSSIAVDVFTATGDTVDVVQIDVPPRAVTAAERADVLERFSGPLREQMQVSEVYPAFSGRVVVDDQSRIWLRRSGSVEEGTEYWIIDRSRRSVVAVGMEGSVVLYDIVDGKVAGVGRAADGSQSVVLYETPG